jgi:hypothetical protein
LDRNLAAANSNCACATRAASGIFVIFRETRGYFSLLPIQWHSSNFFWVFYWYF